tara:strand:- start:131 stop:436 length:306 start_codon:yes stop_codon:yes gene_type:complete
MKKIMTLGLLLSAFTLTTYSQNKPKATYQVGKSVVTVWENKKEGKNGEYTEKIFKIEKIYKKDGKWKETNYFNLTDLLQLRAAIDKAINEEAVKIKQEGEK